MAYKVPLQDRVSHFQPGGLILLSLRAFFALYKLIGQLLDCPLISLAQPKFADTPFYSIGEALTPQKDLPGKTCHRSLRVED